MIMKIRKMKVGSIPTVSGTLVKTANFTVKKCGEPEFTINLADLGFNFDAEDVSRYDVYVLVTERKKRE